MNSTPQSAIKAPPPVIGDKTIENPTEKAHALKTALLNVVGDFSVNRREPAGGSGCNGGYASTLSTEEIEIGCSIRVGILVSPVSSWSRRERASGLVASRPGRY
jgi:hypothetical protein